MRKRNLFAMSLISMALVACSADEDINPANNGNGNEEGGALVSLKLDFANPQTKAGDMPTAGPTKDDVEAESTVNDVAIAIFSEGGARKVVTTKTGGGATKGTDGIEFTAPLGKTDFYVFANVSDADITNLTAATSTTINTVVSDGTTNYFDVTNKSFGMSNKNGAAATATILENSDNVVPVTIERMASKVTVSSLDQLSGDQGGWIKSMSFGLANMIDKTYLLANNGESGSKRTCPTGTTFSAKTATTDMVTVTPAAANPATSDPIYCLENTHANSDYKQGNTTYAFFQTSFVPEKVLNIGTTATDGVYPIEGETTQTGTTDAASFRVVLTSTDESLVGSYINVANIPTGVTISNTADENGVCTVTGLKDITGVSEVYTDGECWFGPIWINYQLDGANQISPMFRNDWYHLAVTSIRVPGSPKEPVIDPEQPLEPDANITVKLTVADWNFVNVEDVELK